MVKFFAYLALGCLKAFIPFISEDCAADLDENANKTLDVIKEEMTLRAEKGRKSESDKNRDTYIIMNQSGKNIK